MSPYDADAPLSDLTKSVSKNLKQGSRMWIINFPKLKYTTHTCNEILTNHLVQNNRQRLSIKA